MFVCLCVSASVFLEFWKRQEAELQYDWDVAAFKQEEVSPGECWVPSTHTHTAVIVT